MKTRIKKKILVFIDWYLPGYKAGGPIQSCANFIAHLKDEFDFKVITRNTDYCETKPYENIKSNKWNILPNGTAVYYFSSDQLNRKNIKNILVNEEYDVVYINGIYSFYFSLLPLYYLRKKKNKLIIIAARGMLAKSALEVKKIKKQFFLFIVKALKLFNNVVFHATTAEELKDIMKQLGERVKIKIASNLPKKNTRLEFPTRIKEQGFAKLINIARIAPEKNLKYALEILKSVKGTIEFDIYGPIYDPSYWNECQAVIKTLPGNIKINYKQSIESDKVAQVLLNYHFMLMPTAGENFGHIILESLNAGCPVIISEQTPWRNLENKNAGWDIALSDPNRFTETIERCIEMNQEEYNKWSKAAFDFSTAFIDDADLVEDNRKLFLME